MSMKELLDLLDNHRLEVESLQDKIEDLQAYKMLSIELANRKGFDSVHEAINSIKPCECVCMIENEVLYTLLSARWSSRDRPMMIVVQEMVDIESEAGK